MPRDIPIGKAVLYPKVQWIRLYRLLPSSESI